LSCQARAAVLGGRGASRWEIEEARNEGYKHIAVPSVRILIRDYSLKSEDEE
jgi:hypothetical protein